MIPYLVAALGLAGGAILFLWQRWKLERALDDVELWHAQSKRLTDDLVSASEQVRRVEEETSVLRNELKAQSDYLEALVRQHPDLVGDYVRQQLFRASRLTTPRAGAQPSLPARTTAPVPVRPGGKRNP